MNKLNLFLLVLVLLQAFAVVVLQDEARKYHIELEKNRKTAKFLEEEYARLMLEQVNLSTHRVIEGLAQKQGLRAPTVEEISVLEP